MSNAKNFLTSTIEKVEYSDKKKQKDKDHASRWWLLDDEMLHGSVFSICNIIETQLQTWRFQCRMYRFLYGNPEAFFTPYSPNAMMNGGAGASNSRRLQINVVQSCIDTAGSMIAKNQPKPQFLTLGEDNYAEQTKAKMLTKYVDGVFDSCGDNGKNLYGVMKKVFLDAALTGTGALKIHIEEGKVKCEWIMPDELIIDNMEGLRETPTQLHRRKFIARDELVYQFPKFEDKIMASSQEVNYSLNNQVNNLVEVIESWHLKSGKDATDGKHSLCINDCTLMSEEYDKDFYPIVFFRWAERPHGFWGRGIAEELCGIQMRINEIMRVIQISQELIAVPIIFIENGSLVQADHMATNDVARIVEYTGAAPNIITPGAVSPELYQHVEWLINQAYQITGISQANATGTKPPEVKSGAAIREVADIASGRFELIGQEWERCFITAAKIIIDLSADLYKEDKSLSVRVKDRKFLKEIKWSDVKLDQDEFGIRVFPISGLPSTPAGKMDQLMDYVQAGWITKDFAMQLIDFPDLEDYVNLETAPLELTRKILSKIVNDGIYIPPSPALNLQLSLSIANLEILRAQVDGVEEDRVQLLQNWIDQLQDLITISTPPSPAPTAQAGVPPQASQAAVGVAPSPQQ